MDEAAVDKKFVQRSDDLSRCVTMVNSHPNAHHLDAPILLQQLVSLHLNLLEHQAPVAAVVWFYICIITRHQQVNN